MCHANSVAVLRWMICCTRMILIIPTAVAQLFTFSPHTTPILSGPTEGTPEQAFRNHLVTGDFFLASVVCSTVTKLVLSLYSMEDVPQHQKTSTKVLRRRLFCTPLIQRRVSLRSFWGDSVGRKSCSILATFFPQVVVEGDHGCSVFGQKGKRDPVVEGDGVVSADYYVCQGVQVAGVFALGALIRGVDVLLKVVEGC